MRDIKKKSHVLFLSAELILSTYFAYEILKMVYKTLKLFAKLLLYLAHRFTYEFTIIKPFKTLIVVVFIRGNTIRSAFFQYHSDVPL